MYNKYFAYVCNCTFIHKLCSMKKCKYNNHIFSSFQILMGMRINKDLSTRGKLFFVVGRPRLVMPFTDFHICTLFADRCRTMKLKRPAINILICFYFFLQIFNKHMNFTCFIFYYFFAFVKYVFDISELVRTLLQISIAD